MKENAPEITRVITILDVIKFEDLTIREDILEEVKRRLSNGQNVAEYEKLISFATIFKAIDDIELIEMDDLPIIAKDSGLNFEKAIGDRAEKRVTRILESFPVIQKVEKAPEELDHEGVDLLAYFIPEVNLGITGVQVKISNFGILEFKRTHNLDDLISRFNLILLNASPRKKDMEIYSQLDRIIQKRIIRANTLTKVS